MQLKFIYNYNINYYFNYTFCFSSFRRSSLVTMSSDNIKSVIESMFSKIDSDKSGSITQTEMDDVFKVFDADGKAFTDYIL